MWLVGRAWLLSAHHQSTFIIGAIVRRQQELLVVHRYPALLLPVTWIWECLDHIMWTIYVAWCCVALLWVPSLDRYSLQLVLTDDSCDPPTYCGHCNTLLREWDPKLSDACWSPSTINVPFRACCLLPLLSVIPFLIFFLSTTVKSAPPPCTATSLPPPCPILKKNWMNNYYIYSLKNRTGFWIIF